MDTTLFLIVCFPETFPECVFSKGILPDRAPRESSSSWISTYLRNHRSAEKGVVLIRGCFKNVIRGFRGSSKYWNLQYLKGVVFKFSSRGSCGFQGSRGFELKNELFNNPLPKQHPSSTPKSGKATELRRCLHPRSSRIRRDN